MELNSQTCNKVSGESLACMYSELKETGLGMLSQHSLVSQLNLAPLGARPWGFGTALRRSLLAGFAESAYTTQREHRVGKRVHHRTISLSESCRESIMHGVGWLVSLSRIVLCPLANRMPSL